MTNSVFGVKHQNREPLMQPADGGVCPRLLANLGSRSLQEGVISRNTAGQCGSNWRRFQKRLLLRNPDNEVPPCGFLPPRRGLRVVLVVGSRSPRPWLTPLRG
jgi:hypothetical protein